MPADGWSQDAARRTLLGHGGAIVWMTGLSGSGKSTLARALERELLSERVLAAVVDGDELRQGLSSGLGFTAEDRRENIRRATEVALYLAQAGLVVVVALISPRAAERAAAAERCRARRVPFAEVFVNAPLAVCEERDPKGLYRKARAGKIPAFTGIDSPYEAPASPVLEIQTALESIVPAVARLKRLALALAGDGRTGSGGCTLQLTEAPVLL